MFVITNSKNVVICIDSNIVREGNIFRLSDGDGIVVSDNHLFDVGTVSEEVKKQVYCYTPELGFFLNVDYKEELSQKTFDDLKKRTENLEKTVDDLVLGGI